MTEIIKNRNGISKTLTFLSKFETKKTIYVPMLYDGVIEVCLSKNNKVICKPADDKFKSLWEILRDEPTVLAKFIEIYPDSIEETSNSLSEVLKIQKNKLSIAYTLLSLTRRSREDTLMGGQLIAKGETFTPSYLQSLQEYKVPFHLSPHEPKDCFTFQDLTYLATDEVSKFSKVESSLFVTNNKQHIYCFDGAECSMIDNYYLIWR